MQWRILSLQSWKRWGLREGRILILCGHIRQGLNLRFVHSSDCNTNASILQEDAIKLILSGKHVVLNIPTGGGKSFPQMAANIFAEGEKFFILILNWNQNIIRGGEDGHPDLASGGSWATIWSWHAKIGIEIRLSDSFTCGLFGGRDQDQEAPRPPGQCWILVSPRHPAANLQDANQLHCCRRGSG